MINLARSVGIALLAVYSFSVGVSYGDVRPNLRRFTFRIRDEPETLDWNQAHTIVESYLLTNLMEGLVTFTSSVDVSPALAQSWSMSPDGKIYTFKIRRGVKWSDGVELKAQDFVYSWKRLLSPLTGSPYSYLLYDVYGAELFHSGTLKDFSQVGVKALDDATLQVTLDHPVAHWISIPAFWVTFPVRQDVVEKYGNSWASPGKIVSLGPYTLTTHDFNSQFILKANANYYGAKGNVDELVAMIVKDDSVALTLYESGILDFVTDFSTPDLKKLKGRADLRILPHLKTGYLGFVTDRYPVSSRNLRRAIAMSIDKSKIGEVLQGEQQPATSFVPPPLMGSATSVGLPFDPEKAKEELKAAGIDSSASVTVNYVVPNWDKGVAIGVFIQQEIKKNLGINLILKKLENQDYRAQLEMRSSPLFDFTWTADYPDPDNFISVFLSTSGNSRTNWKNQRYDELAQAARHLTDPVERLKLYLELQKILLEEDAVIVPLYYEPNLALVRPRVKSFEINPMDYLFLRKVSVAP